MVQCAGIACTQVRSQEGSEVTRRVRRAWDTVFLSVRLGPLLWEEKAGSI